MLTQKPGRDPQPVPNALSTARLRTTARTRRIATAVAIVGIAAATAAVTVIAVAQSSVPTLQSLIPKDAEMAGSIQANWLWDATASIRKMPEVSKALANAEARTGLSFENDIVPWAGQVGVAADQVSDKGGQVIVYAQIRDYATFMSTIAKLEHKLQNTPAPAPGSKNAGGPPTFSTRDFHGVTIYDITRKHNGPKDEPMSFAVVNGWAIGAFGKGAIEHALDVYQGRFPSIQSSPSWSPVFAHLPHNATAWTGFDMGGLMKAFGGAPFKGATAAMMQSNYAFSLSDEGNGLRFDVVTAPQTAKGQAVYSEFARNLKPVSGQILKKVPDGVLAGMITNPGYFWTFIKRTMLETAATPKERREVAKGLKASAALDHTLPYFHGDAGFVVTWRKDRGFGLVLLAHGDSHAAALHAATVLARSVKQMGIPLQRGGNSWAAVIPGMSMMMPPNVPIKLAPFLSAKDDWLVIGSNPSWTAPTSETPALKMPAYAAGAPVVGVLSMRFLPALLDTIEQQAPPDDTDVKQGLALARGLHLEASTWTNAGRYDAAGRYSQSTIEIANWDWRGALDNTVTAIQNWKPAPKKHIGHDLLKHGADLSQSTPPASGA